MEPRYIAVEEIRLLEVNETLLNTMIMRIASEKLSGEWECRVYQPKYKLLWVTSWFRLQVLPFDAYRRLTMGPVAQSLVGGVRGTVIYSLLGTIAGLAALAGGMYWIVRRRQRRIQAQLVLFKQSGLWSQSGETATLLAGDSEAEEGEEEEEEEGEEQAGAVLVEVPEETEIELTAAETTDEG
ncbi:hypothetical protein FJT64_019724 [Amphibalanus amphitrite]|uniref:Uncharacterized protein n=1 Tax=Amphibalanus amphitrite TaxID=1232801 RepID=A0A6A4X460_AMPAM|nr:hypothetical protein FJT64_019724 [Amphibalanus amphitrite]